MFFFREHRLGVTCYVFFSREMPTQVPEINATCFFFEHGKWAEIHVYLFFILARLRRAKFPFSVCISALARLRRAKFLIFPCFLPWCACSMPYSWVLSPFFALAHRWHALTCMFFSRLFGAPAAVDVLCFFFAPLARINVLCFFFSRDSANSAEIIVLCFLFRGHLQKIITL